MPETGVQLAKRKQCSGLIDIWLKLTANSITMRPKKKKLGQACAENPSTTSFIMTTVSKSREDKVRFDRSNFLLLVHSSLLKVI